MLRAKGAPCAQRARATVARRADKIAGSVTEVATGLAGLRVEVHSLRGALQDHANATDARIGELKAEVTHVRGRVDVLERPVTRKPARRG